MHKIKINDVEIEVDGGCLVSVAGNKVFITKPPNYLPWVQQPAWSQTPSVTTFGTGAQCLDNQSKTYHPYADFANTK